MKAVWKPEPRDTPLGTRWAVICEAPVVEKVEHGFASATSTTLVPLYESEWEAKQKADELNDA